MITKFNVFAEDSREGFLPAILYTLNHQFKIDMKRITSREYAVDAIYVKVQSEYLDVFQVLNNFNKITRELSKKTKQEIKQRNITLVGFYQILSNYDVTSDKVSIRIDFMAMRNE